MLTNAEIDVLGNQTFNVCFEKGRDVCRQYIKNCKQLHCKALIIWVPIKSHTTNFAEPGTFALAICRGCHGVKKAHRERKLHHCWFMIARILSDLKPLEIKTWTQVDLFCAGTIINEETIYNSAIYSSAIDITSQTSPNNKSFCIP